MDRLQVIYEDNHLIAVNKPAGVLVHGDITEDVPLSEYVKDYIKVRYNKPGDVFLGVIHRLDRPVSGAVVFARTSKALTRMNRLFQERQVKKTYLAITTRRPDPIVGHLTHYIAKDRQRNVARIFEQASRRSEAAGAKLSELDYEMIGGIGNYVLLRVFPQTGRPHQIRVQLAGIGCPILGDVKYGYPRPNEDASIHLHCRELSFIHPVKKEPVRITAALPFDPVWEEFEEVISR